MSKDLQVVTIIPKSQEVEQILDQVDDEDPATLLCWDTANVTNAVTFLNGLHVGAAAPPWLGAGIFPIAPLDLELGILVIN